MNQGMKAQKRLLLARERGRNETGWNTAEDFRRGRFQKRGGIEEEGQIKSNTRQETRPVTRHPKGVSQQEKNPIQMEWA